MGFLKRGPRVYRVFISHRYDDYDIYSALLRHLVGAKNFKYQNLSVEVDKQLDTASPGATKRSLSAKIRNADVLLVFAHSSGEMVDYELDRADHYGVPVISIVDPARIEVKHRRVRAMRIEKQARCEVRLDEPDRLISEIRSIARPQKRNFLDRGNMPTGAAHEPQGITTPRDIAQRLSEPQRRQGLVSRIGAFLFGQNHSGTGRDKGF